MLRHHSRLEQDALWKAPAVPNLIIGKAEVVVPILLSKFASQKDNLKTPYTRRISNGWTTVNELRL